ncbi:DinB family protein [Streptomyces canus]|uniref:DinB family protein n=1 Tax=Streptomyces canus TaxID=58343 RepID=UPI0033A55DAE
MNAGPRLTPLLDQFDWSCERLAGRLTGPVMDSGDGSRTPVGAMTDDEYLWEPVPDCWSVRRRTHGPGARAAFLAGTGDWGRDAAPHPHPVPPPFTTLAWRLSHLSEMLFLRADHTTGTHTLTRDDYRVSGSAADAIAAFDAAADAWRTALRDTADTDLDTVGRCTYPHGSDPEEPFLDIVWWVNQEVLHHGGEIALLRDLYRERRR